MQALSIEVRAGLHTGECEVRGDDIGGIAAALTSSRAFPANGDYSLWPLRSGWVSARLTRSPRKCGTLFNSDTGTSYDGTPERLAALARGEVVEIRAVDLPAWARVGAVCRWWTRAVVRPDNTVTFRDDDGSAWLAENGLD